METTWAGNGEAGEVYPWEIWARSWWAGWAFWQRCLLAPWSLETFPGAGGEAGAGDWPLFGLQGLPFDLPFPLPSLTGSLSPLPDQAFPEGLASPQRLSFRLALPGWWGKAPETYRVEAVLVREVGATPQALPASPEVASLPKPAPKARPASKRRKTPEA